ncbi:hypothetical protein OHB26_38765 (plasmid) [Nocardia sp. NBC_01503]|uniref:hypothetical protein n=1 Tax=Nocardia sp. NBC_01503 TaxID=2975997 RepID=UPI002E7BB04D|nr:hypothetical protein [Nocardia sp. NBC_01503]WTL36621.1 hypothetical protein OHB26_38765 [Nocardia sp. NBC_01503]
MALDVGPLWLWIAAPIVVTLLWQIHQFGYGPGYWRTRDPQQRTALRAAARIRRTWPRTARKLRMVEHDPQNPNRKRIPPIVATTIGPEGIVLEFGTVVGIGLAEFEKHASHLINAWRTPKVDVWQAEAGRIQVRIPHGRATKPTVYRPASDLGR